MQSQSDELKVARAFQPQLKRSNEGAQPKLKKPKLKSKEMKKALMQANKISKYFQNAPSSSVTLVGGKRHIGSPRSSKTISSESKVKLDDDKKLRDCGQPTDISKTPTLQVKDVGKKTYSTDFFKSAIVKTKVNVCDGTALPNNNLDSSADPIFLSFIPELTDAISWKNIRDRDLDLDYAIIFPKAYADDIFRRLENEVEYYTGDYTKLKVFGKWHQIPRKQVAYGDEGLTYAFSGNCLPAKSWTPLLAAIKDVVEKASKNSYNFVLLNRYNDGNDHIGEHRDDEKELVAGAPIASLSFGQERDFLLRHATLRLKNPPGNISGAPAPPAPITVPLQHGSLLLMKPPTNKFWYHSLPVRKRAFRPRINLTFRSLMHK